MRYKRYFPSFRDLSSLLFPFVDHYPSIHKSDLLQSLIKLKKAYPTWTDLRIAEYLKLPEIKTRNVPVAKYARQNVRSFLLYDAIFWKENNYELKQARLEIWCKVQGCLPS